MMTLPTRTTPLTLPLWVWGRLATVAENQGITVADVIADALLAVVNTNPKVRAPRTAAPVVESDELALLRAEVEAARRAGWRPPRAQQRKFSKERVKELMGRIRELHGLGLPDADIAVELGVGDSTVHRYRNRMGLPVVGKAGRPPKEGKAA